MKKRSPALGILFTIITGGIYGIYWFIKLTNDSNTLAPGNKCASGGLAFLFSLITGGVYTLYWFYKLGNKVGEMSGEKSHGVLYLLLTLFTGIGGVICYCLAQSAVNKAIDKKNAEAAAAATQVNA